MRTVTQHFTRSRGQLIWAALFAPMGTLLDTRHDKWIQKETEEVVVYKERVVIGTPTKVEGYSTYKPDPTTGNSKNYKEAYTLNAERAFEIAESLRSTLAVAVRPVTLIRIGEDFFKFSEVKLTPIELES